MDYLGPEKFLGSNFRFWSGEISVNYSACECLSILIFITDFAILRSYIPPIKRLKISDLLEVRKYFQRGRLEQEGWPRRFWRLWGKLKESYIVIIFWQINEILMMWTRIFGFGLNLTVKKHHQISIQKVFSLFLIIGSLNNL